MVTIEGLNSKFILIVIIFEHESLFRNSPKAANIYNIFYSKKFGIV
jgi:hypothetical protein